MAVPRPNEVIGVARTSAVAPPAESTLGGATILPGVPLPMWGRAEEPVLPDPPPRPAPEPATMAMTPGADADVDLADAPAPVPAAPTAAPPPVPFLAPVETPAAASAPADDQYPDPPGADDGLAEALAAPVPVLDPPAPTAPVAAAYAAAGAAPPTAPWGTPPAPVPTVGPEPVPTPDPVAAPVGLAPPSGDPVPVGVGAHSGPEPAVDGQPDAARRRLVLLGAVGGVVVLGAVAAFGWPGLLVARDDSAGAPPAPPTAPVSAPVTLRAPQTVAGLTLLPGATADALGKAATGTTIAGYTAPVSAVYGTGTTPVATVIAWTATKRGTPAEVSTAFAGYQGATGRVITAITPVPPGAPGGRMSCGTSVVGSTPATVCFWSDDATFGAITVLRPATAAQGATLATTIRSAVETRG